MNFQEIMRAWAKAVVAQFRFKILLLSLIPLFLSMLLWGGLMAWRLQSVFDFIQSYFSSHESFSSASDVLNSLGLLTLKTVIVPLLAMWLLLPVMMLTSLLFIGVLVMPVISRHVGQRDYPQLEKRRGGSVLGGLAYALGSFLIFVMVWIVSLPLIFFPPVYVFVQPLLWGWLTYRIMSYDALAEHADVAERKEICAKNRGSLILMGVIAGMFGSLASLLWMGGAMAIAYVVFFPLFVSLAIFLSLVIFIFTGLWYQHFCLAALQTLRQTSLPSKE